MPAEAKGVRVMLLRRLGANFEAQKGRPTVTETKGGETMAESDLLARQRQALREFRQTEREVARERAEAEQRHKNRSQEVQNLARKQRQEADKRLQAARQAKEQGLIDLEAADSLTKAGLTQLWPESSLPDVGKAGPAGTQLSRSVEAARQAAGALQLRVELSLIHI